ncbi:kinase-like protein [Atractiella rhizophila]|nr:kinase-like protein [Atractiella rhizophila]
MVDRMVPTSPTLCSQPIPFNQPPTERLTIGRAKNNCVCLDAKIISNFHCEIWIDHNGDVWLKDTSSNGTYVRQSKVGNEILTILKHGDKLNSEVTRKDMVFVGKTRMNLSLRIPCHSAEVFGWRKYDFIESLRMNSFGKVCRVIERGTSNVLAVEHFKKSRLKSETSKGMFEKEMAILNEINHPNVVKLIECFDDDNDLCLVREYVNGGDLLSYISKRGGLFEEDARQIAKMLFPAIAAFHAKKIVHRDLKPGSILITHVINPVVKIVDFGLAKMLQESELRTTWVAPEAIAKEFGPYTDKCDAWGLGLVILSCMINALPFDPENSEVPLATRLERRVPKWTDLPDGTFSRMLQLPLSAMQTKGRRADERYRSLSTPLDPGRRESSSVETCTTGAILPQRMASGVACSQSIVHCNEKHPAHPRRRRVPLRVFSTYNRRLTPC